MKNAIILHGMPDPGQAEYYNPKFPSASNSHWLPWLQRHLQLQDVAAATPEVPNSWKPHYETWRSEFERYDVTPETILVGHSCGGGFMVRWLSEHKDVQVGRVVLVAPWVDPDRTDTTDFFDFELDSHLVKRTGGVTIFESDNDMNSVQSSIRFITEAVVGIKRREFHNYGHFTIETMKTQEFPELLEESLR